MKNRKIALFILVLSSLYGDAERGTVDFFAKALYWYPSQTTDWSFTLNSFDNRVESNYKSLQFDWAPGFSVGFGVNIDHDTWDVRAGYTWFQADATDHANGPLTSAFLGARTSLLEAIDLFSYGEARLHLDYNLFDIDLGTHFFVSKYLSMRPMIGIKGGWINQKINTFWVFPTSILNASPINASENLEQSFQGGGPKGGVEAKWYLGKYFHLLNQFVAGYLWGHWVIDDVFVDDLNTIVTIDTDSRNFGSFMVHALIGIGCDWDFNENRSHVGVQIGYEIQDWFNHLQIFTNTSGSQNNNLILQGINFGVSVDF